MHRLGDKIAVLSLFEMAEIITFSNFTIESYILKNIYALAVLCAANGGAVPDDASSWTHDDVRGCLFDMNASKPDIVFSMHKPKLCEDCRRQILAKQVDPGFLPALDKELPRIKKALYFRIVEWIKMHPICAIAITSAFAIIPNLVASAIFAYIKILQP